MTIPDAAGVFGVLLILIAYAGVQLERLQPLQYPALLLNFFGAGLVLYSLTAAFNLAAVIMETVWVAIAAYGIVRRLLRR